MTITPITPLQLLRRQARLSQSEVASALGVTQPTISRLESGERSLDRHVAALARVLGVSEGEVREAAAGHD